MTIENFENMDAHSRNHYLRQLLKEDHEITFTKLDGTERTMPCTLRADAIPQRQSSEPYKTRPYNPEVLSVWCLDKSEWRSFKTMNVISIKKL